MQAPTEVFFCRVPGSNFSGSKANIVFIQDRYNPSLGRYETADPVEIAELRAAIRGGAPTIFQDPTQLPYSKSANPMDAEEQRKNVDRAARDIELRREAAAFALRNKPPAGQAINEQVQQEQSQQSNQQQGVGGIVNTSTIAENTVGNQVKTPAQLAIEAAQRAQQNK